MTIRIVTKPPIGNIKTDRIKAMLRGNHTLEQKLCMSRQVLNLLQLEGFECAGQIDWWIPLIGRDGHEMTHFSNGKLISASQIIIDNPYDCAADNYEMRRQRPASELHQPY